MSAIDYLIIYCIIANNDITFHQKILFVKKNNVTIKDVALKAGVSIGAVSSVFSKKPSNVRLSPETRKHILNIAKEINYYPSITAKGFNSGKSYLLGFFFCHQNWHVLSRLLQSIQRVCYDHEYDLIVYPAETLAMERRNLERARNRNLDGIITLPFVCDEGNNLELYREFAERRIPIVQFMYKITDEFSYVGRDYAKVARDAVKKLYDLGHRRIGLLVHKNYIDPIQGRSANILARSYSEEMDKYGIEPTIYPLSCSFESHKNNQQEIVRLIMETRQRPTALIASANGMAYHAIGGLQKVGIRVPEDMSIIGAADNVNLLNSDTPELSYYSIPAQKIGLETAEKCLNNISEPSETLIFEPLIDGKTTQKIQNK